MQVKASFNGLQIQEFDVLSKVTVRLAERMFENKEYLVQMKAGEAKVLAIGLHGKSNAGKSRFAKAFLNAGLTNNFESQGQKTERPESEHSVKLIDIPVWQSHWCSVIKRENRMRDCLLTDPYHMPAGRYDEMSADVSFFTPYMRPREYSGFEILEHCRSVPENLLSIKIDIVFSGNLARDVSVFLPNSPGDGTEYIAELRDMFWSELRRKRPKMQSRLDYVCPK